MIYTLILVVIIIYIIKFIFTEDPPPKSRVYKQPGKWYRLKFWAFYVLFNLRKRQNAQKKSASSEGAGYGVRSRNTPEDMDKVQELPKEHKMAVDAVYFNGANKEGYYLVGATARRHNNLVQTLLYIRVPDLGMLELTSLPDTSLYTTKEMSFSAGGLHIEPVEPMKKWKLTFEGKMRLTKKDGKDQEVVDVRFDIDWTADTKFFDFDTDLNSFAMCDSMARETWSREFFKQLQVAHQTHYEQFGVMTGTVHIGQYGERKLHIRGVRDHSYGNLRDWADLHRYGIQYISLEDGRAVCIGNICMPRTLSRIPMGYVFQKDGRMDVVEWTDFELFEHGEDGNPPRDMELSFKAGEEIYRVKIHVLDAPIFYMGENWEARIHERMCTFVVNGTPGWGISEWDYRNHTGKPDIYKNTQATVKS